MLLDDVSGVNYPGWKRRVENWSGKQASKHPVRSGKGTADDPSLDGADAMPALMHRIDLSVAQPAPTDEEVYAGFGEDEGGVQTHAEPAYYSAANNPTDGYDLYADVEPDADVDVQSGKIAKEVRP